MTYQNPPNSPPVIFNGPVSFSAEEMVRICHVWGPTLLFPPDSGIDGARFLAASSRKESTFGTNCKPRHEAGYCTGGRYGGAPEVVALTAKYGHAAHSSFSAWQIMLVNAPGDPEQFASLDYGARVVVQFINRRILGQQRATTLQQVFASWNMGHWTEENVTAPYVLDCMHFYNTVPLPDLPA